MKGQTSSAELLKRISGQVEGAEIYEAHSLTVPILFRNNALESIQSTETAGRAVRVIRQGRLGFSTSTDLADGDTLIRNTLAAAAFGDPASFSFPAQQPSTEVPGFDPEIEQLSEAEMIDLGKEIIARIRAYSSELDVDVEVEKEIQVRSVRNTSGLQVEERRSVLAVGASAQRSREGDILTAYRAKVSGRYQDIDGQAMADAIVQSMRWSERIVRVEPRPLPVILQHDATAILFIPLLAGLNGRTVYMNASPLSTRLGQQAFDPRFTLVDDGCMPFAPRSGAYDDEGTPMSTKALIDQGVVRHFFYDLRTASMAGASSTGNGFKTEIMGPGGLRRQPSPAPSTWRVAPGERSLQQILEGLDEALLIESLIGVGQGNDLSGEFSNNINLGFLVRRGEVIGRVKGTMIAGNVYQVLKDQLLELSNRTMPIGGFLHVPDIALDRVSVIA